MGEVLSQEEINTLLKGLSEGEIEEGSVETQSTPQNIKRFDLANQERIVRGRMPTMELIHDRFSRQFRTALGKFLGRSCFTNVGKIEMIKFGGFLKKLPLPSSLHILKMSSLPGNALLVVSAPLVFSVIDGLFGGRGTTRVKVEGREYTAIETSLIGKVVNLAIELLNEAWNPVHPVEFQFVRSEFNPFAVTIAPPSDMVVLITIEVEFEQECTTLSICIPYSTLEPIKNKLSTAIQSTRLEVDSALSRRMYTNIQETICEVSVQLARGSVKLKELIDLKIGDVLQLDTLPSEEARIMVEGTPKLYGHVGALHGNRAIKISRAIPRADLVTIRNKEEMS